MVEEDLRAASAVRAIVELSGCGRREACAKPEDRHEFVVVPVGGREIRNADADVVDESGTKATTT